MQEPSAHTVHFSITHYITLLGYSTDIYNTTTGRLPTRDFLREKLEKTLQPEHHYIRRESLRGKDHARKPETLQQKPRTERRSNLEWPRHYYWSTHHSYSRVWKTTIENNPHTTKEQQIDKTLLLKVTLVEGEYDNSKKKTDKDKQPIPPRLYDLKCSTTTRITATCGYYTRTSYYSTTTRITNSRNSHRKDNTSSSADTSSSTTTSRTQTTRTTLAKNDLLATIDTGVLHLTTNEDVEEKKLSLDNMHLQEWYDDDNEDYDTNEIKTAIKEEHDSLQKTNVFTR
eukprot:3754667-Amphidinium_carterae.1